MGRAPKKSAGGSRAGEDAARSEEYQELAFALAEKELENRKLKVEKAEYKRKYDDLMLTLKALAEGAGHVVLPVAAVAAAASGAPRELDKKEKRDAENKAFMDKNFHLKVHHRQGKPVVADAVGKIHEKVEDARARQLRVRREQYALDKRGRAALTAPGSGVPLTVAALAADAASGARGADDSSGSSRPPLAAIGGEDAAAGARRTHDSAGASSCARAQGSAGGQSSSASGAAAAEAEASPDPPTLPDPPTDDGEETGPEEPPSKKIKHQVWDPAAQMFIRKKE